jgi:hypothetical protein
MHREESWYDVMQVCRNGHKITDYAQSHPIGRQNFCAECGKETIDACQACGVTIRGCHHVPGVLGFFEIPVPKHCINCGAAYPWQASAIENLMDILHESTLTSQEIQELERALPDILSDTPKTDSASLKVKRILGRMGKPLYDVGIKVFSDIASETAKKSLGLS